MDTVSIIVVSWNTREMLRGTLAALSQELEGCSGVDVEVLVVDNGSTDGSADMVRNHFPKIRLIANKENLGFAQANNQAIGVARGELILLLNSDAEICRGTLAKLTTFMAERPQAGAVGPRLLNADGTLQPSCHPMLTPEREFWRLAFFDRLVPWATYRMTHWRTDLPRRVEVIKGACLLLRREAIEQVGKLDDRYFMYAEEVDLCYRLAQAGWELWWVPEARVVHYGEASSRQEAEKMYLQLYRSKVQFYRKFGGEETAERFKLLVRLAYWPRVVLRPRTEVYRRLLAELGEM